MSKEKLAHTEPFPAPPSHYAATYYRPLTILLTLLSNPVQVSEVLLCARSHPWLQENGSVSTFTVPSLLLRNFILPISSAFCLQAGSSPPHPNPRALLTQIHSSH
jgi:hypothetical protein